MKINRYSTVRKPSAVFNVVQFGNLHDLPAFIQLVEKKANVKFSNMNNFAAFDRGQPPHAFIPSIAFQEANYKVVEFECGDFFVWQEEGDKVIDWAVVGKDNLGYDFVPLPNDYPESVMGDNRKFTSLSYGSVMVTFFKLAGIPRLSVQMMGSNTSIAFEIDDVIDDFIKGWK
jgi:hypothetical protein